MPLVPTVPQLQVLMELEAVEKLLEPSDLFSVIIWPDPRRYTVVEEWVRCAV